MTGAPLEPDGLDAAVRDAEARIVDSDLALQDHVDALVLLLRRDARATLVWAAAALGLGVAVALLRALGGVALGETLGERGLELAAPRAEPLLVSDAAALGGELVFTPALVELALEARLPLEEHLLDRRANARLCLEEPAVKVLLERVLVGDLARCCRHPRSRWDGSAWCRRGVDRLRERLLEFEPIGETLPRRRGGLLREKTHR